VSAQFQVKRDFKKKTLEMLTHYKTIGIMEGNGDDRYSIASRQRELQRSASS